LEFRMKIGYNVFIKIVVCYLLFILFPSELIFAKETIINLIGEDYKPLSYLKNDSLNGPFFI